MNSLTEEEVNNKYTAIMVVEAASPQLAREQVIEELATLAVIEGGEFSGWSIDMLPPVLATSPEGKRFLAEAWERACTGWEAAADRLWAEMKDWPLQLDGSNEARMKRREILNNLLFRAACNSIGAITGYPNTVYIGELGVHNWEQLFGVMHPDDGEPPMWVVSVQLIA